MENNLI